MGEKDDTPILAWHAHQRVVHKITGREGEVMSVDFEEDLVEVVFEEWTSWCRMENLREATS